MSIQDDIFGVVTAKDLISVVYTFVPLPYHHCSWIPAQFTPYVIDKCRADMESCLFHPYINYVFAHQDEILEATDRSYDEIKRTF